MSRDKKPAGRVSHGAPPEPLPTPPNAWPIGLTWYKPDDVFALPRSLTSSTKTSTKTNCIIPDTLKPYLACYPFVFAIATNQGPCIVAGLEYAGLAQRLKLPSVLVIIVTPNTSFDMKFLELLLMISPSLPHAPDRRATTIYKVIVELVKRTRHRLFIDDTSVLEALLSVMGTKNAYKIHSNPEPKPKRTIKSKETTLSSQNAEALTPADEPFRAHTPHTDAPQPVLAKPAEEKSPTPEASSERHDEKKGQCDDEDSTQALNDSLLHKKLFEKYELEFYRGICDMEIQTFLSEKAAVNKLAGKLKE